MPKNKPKIFISYSHSDRPHATRLESEFKSIGVKVFVDYEEIKLGESFPERVNKALKWCDTLILLWSKAAKGSHWVAREWEYAVKERKRLIPFIIDGTELPPLLSTTQYFDSREIGENLSQLFEVLELTPAQPTPVVTQKATVIKPKTPKVQTLKYKLRATPTELTEEDAMNMIRVRDFFDMQLNEVGLGIKHQYQKKVDGLVISDQATDLMWQQSGSPNSMQFEGTKRYVAQLKADSFAGYSDWRLPTLEEAISLMEPKERNGELLIDPIFKGHQRYVWTSDHLSKPVWLWVVNFYVGYCYLKHDKARYYVRAVR